MGTAGRIDEPRLGRRRRRELARRRRDEARDREDRRDREAQHREDASARFEFMDHVESVRREARRVLPALYTRRMTDAPRLAKLMKLLDAEPDDAFCLYAIAQEHARLGDASEAIAWFDRTIAADPSHAYARFHKAKVLESEGRVPEAIETLREGLAAAEASRDGKAASEIAGALASLGS